jgi:hypothetical protein
MKLAVINLKTNNICLQFGLTGKMDGSMDVWMDEWPDGWIDEWINGWTYGLMDVLLNGKVKGWMNRRMYG